MNTITVVIVPGQEKPYSEEISNDLATFQKLVGGYIEVIALSDRLMIICNENGKLEGLEGNRRFKNNIIVGDFFIAADGGDGDFTSLTDDEINAFHFSGRGRGQFFNHLWRMVNKQRKPPLKRVAFSC